MQKIAKDLLLVSCRRLLRSSLGLSILCRSPYKAHCALRDTPKNIKTEKGKRK